MKAKICKTAIVSGAIICFLALGLPAAVKAGPGTDLPPPPTAALSCKDPGSTLSAADCAHFNEIIRHLDRVSVATLENLAFLDEIQTELVASAAYQDALNQGLSEAESLRLQLALDRTSRFLQTLSNILKKISETSETIVQNLKD
jgi:hypothetical protein